MYSGTIHGAIYNTRDIIAINPGMIHGDAWPGINLNPNNSGERAEAVISFLQQVISSPRELFNETWKTLLKYGTGYQWIELGQKTAPMIQKEIDKDPQLKQTLDRAYSIAKSVGEYVVDTTSPYLWIAKNGPYILGGLLIVGIYFLFQNPGAVKPEKVSLF